MHASNIPIPPPMPAANLHDRSFNRGPDKTLLHQELLRSNRLLSTSARDNNAILGQQMNNTVLPAPILETHKTSTVFVDQPTINVATENVLIKQAPVLVEQEAVRIQQEDIIINQAPVIVESQKVFVQQPTVALEHQQVIVEAAQVEVAAPQVFVEPPRVIVEQPEILVRPVEVVTAQAAQIIQAAPEIITSAPVVITHAPQIFSQAPIVQVAAPRVVQMEAAVIQQTFAQPIMTTTQQTTTVVETAAPSYLPDHRFAGENLASGRQQFRDNNLNLDQSARIPVQSNNLASNQSNLGTNAYNNNTF